MDVQRLKEYILENDKIEIVLDTLGCNHIKNRGEYYTCSNPDGDNKSAVVLYQNENLTCINYTRDITNGKNIGTDIFSLVEFFQQCSFFEAIKFVCEWIGLDFYYDFDEDIPESLKLTRMIIELQKDGGISDEEKPLKPISENILKYYHPYVNEMFKEDGIDYEVQKLFEIGYDSDTNRITIPIRDEIGNLVGVKGRYFYRDVPEHESKYYYIEKCARSQILYGLYLTYPYIKQNKSVFVMESEKGVLQAYSYGYYNCVATSGKKISNAQIEKLTRLCVDIIFCLDSDVSQQEIEILTNRFIDGVNIYAILDKDKLLKEKESPVDRKDIFEILCKNNLYKLK